MKGYYIKRVSVIEHMYIYFHDYQELHDYIKWFFLFDWIPSFHTTFSEKNGDNFTANFWHQYGGFGS